MELKNDLQVKGTLMSVDQYLNIKLDNTSVLNKLAEIAANFASNRAPSGSQVNDEAQFPHLMAVKNCFIRGSVIR